MTSAHEMESGHRCSSGRLLLVTPCLESLPRGGRAQLTFLNYSCLLEILGERLELLELRPNGTPGAHSPLAAWYGHLDGLTAASIEKVCSVVRSRNISQVFLDGSNLGILAATLKKRMPELTVTTFFHNVESKFFLGAFAKRRSIHALGVLAANFLAEWRAVSNSDRLICLSGRDSALLRRVYGRSATHIFPLAVPDKLTSASRSAVTPSYEQYALFVGGTFYANHAGIRWFVREVAPRLAIRTVIVGVGFDELRSQLEVPGKVEVIGAVDDLGPWYRDAKFVIAPIFDGSGMKTKVAEALMFGKTVIGSPEAFSGYEVALGSAGTLCRNAEEFISAIRRAESADIPTFDANLRQLYELHYSKAAALVRLRTILTHAAPE